jgi:phosphatidylinositol dimannoside acyltransferase
VRGLLLRAGLEGADLLARALPRGIAYALVDLAGRAWYRFGSERRALVTANLARVGAATGGPVEGPALRRLARQAFIEHARYYLEILRIPHRSVEEIGEMVTVEDWDRWDPVLRAGAVVTLPHIGNVEPYGSFMVAHGLQGVAPVEEIRPRELFDFLRARRASGRGVELIPLSKARRPMLQALRDGKIAGLISDRDLGGDGIPVTLFGHATTMPTGPAVLSLLSGRPLVAAACLRLAPERFVAWGWLIEVPLSGDRRADAAAMTAAVARRFEEAIAKAPEQWWAIFQPLWNDQRGKRRK